MADPMGFVVHARLNATEAATRRVRVPPTPPPAYHTPWEKNPALANMRSEGPPTSRLTGRPNCVRLVPGASDSRAPAPRISSVGATASLTFEVLLVRTPNLALTYV